MPLVIANKMADVVDIHEHRDLFDSEKRGFEKTFRPLQPHQFAVLPRRDADLFLEKVTESRVGEIDAKRDLADGARRAFSQ